MIITPEMIGILERMAHPGYAAAMNPHVIADVAHRANVALTSPVYCLTSPESFGPVGVYRTRELAEKAKERFSDVGPLRIEAFPVEDEI